MKEDQYRSFLISESLLCRIINCIASDPFIDLRQVSQNEMPISESLLTILVNELAQRPFIKVHQVISDMNGLKEFKRKKTKKKKTENENIVK